MILQIVLQNHFKIGNDLIQRKIIRSGVLKFLSSFSFY